MISIRPATIDDSSTLLAWRNDDRTRHASISRELVTVDEHEAWLKRSLSSDRRFIFIATTTGSQSTELAVGMCRFDISTDGTSAEVSLNLGSEFRGRGYSLQILTTAIERFHAIDGAPNSIRATIRIENQVSKHVFERAGFEKTHESGEFAYYSLG
jgi:UDP-2,4-diacetamido-2,4,6-trideoxy-beta-L-altropyranose hydrolase